MIKVLKINQFDIKLGQDDIQHAPTGPSYLTVHALTLCAPNGTGPPPIVTYMTEHGPDLDHFDQG
jgi:hypothetical protein